MAFLDEIEKLLDMSANEKRRVMAEVRSHYRELEEELVKAGMHPEDAAREASRRMGRPGHIAGCFHSIPRAASWRSTLLAGFPGAAFFIITVICGTVGSRVPGMLPVLWISLLSILAVVMSVGSITQLAAGKRPEWLAAWLPAAMALVTILLFHPPDGLPSKHACQVLGMSLAVLLGGLAAWLLRDAPGQAVAAAVLAGVAAWRVLTFASFWDFVLIAIVMLVLLSASAIKLFVGHRYGNGTQSALFLFSFFNLLIVGLIIVGNLFTVWQPGYQGPLFCLLLIGAWSGLATRLVDTRLKLAALFIGGTLVWPIMIAWSGLETGQFAPAIDYVKGLLVAAVFGALSIIPPLVYEQFHREDMPTPAL